MKEKKKIGVCAASIHEYSVNNVLNVLSEEANERNFELHIFAPFSDLYNNTKIDVAQGQIFEFLRETEFDALVIFSDMIKNDKIKEQLIEYGKNLGIPMVSMKGKLDGCCTIMYDAETAIGEMIRHAVNVHGCKRINFITGTKGNIVAERRLKIYRDAMAECGIPVEEDRIGYGDFWAVPTKDEVDRILASDYELPDAIVCANDAMAIATCERLMEKGIKVPEDVIVTGMGGIHEREYHFPLVTTGEYNHGLAGQYIFKVLDEMFEGKNLAGEVYTVPCKTIFSESCGCVKHNLGIMDKRLVSTYRMLEFERSYQHEINNLISAVNNSCNLITLAEDLPNYIIKPGIQEYNIYIKSDFAYTAGLELNIDFERQKYMLLSSYVNEKNDISLELLDNVKFQESKTKLLNTNSHLMYIPLHSEDTFYGTLTIGYSNDIIKPEILYKLIMTINISLDTIIKRYELDRVSHQLNLVSEQTILSLAEIVEAKSEVTGLHVKRVSEYTRILAKAMGFSNEEVNIIRIASMMHDIGKINIPSEILEKPGRLTEEEFEIIKTHVTEGERMLINSPGDIMETACIIAKQHHEKWNGTGYLGLKGEEINIESRIVALADVYDALVSVRPYKPAFPSKKAYDIIVGDSGTHFDPAVVEVFVVNFDKFIEIQNQYVDE